MFVILIGVMFKNDFWGSGIGCIMVDFIDSSLNWKDIVWLRKVIKMFIVLKGV